MVATFVHGQCVGCRKYHAYSKEFNGHENVVEPNIVYAVESHRLERYADAEDDGSERCGAFIRFEFQRKQTADNQKQRVDANQYAVAGGAEIVMVLHYKWRGGGIGEQYT